MSFRCFLSLPYCSGRLEKSVENVRPPGDAVRLLGHRRSTSVQSCHDHDRLQTKTDLLSTPFKEEKGHRTRTGTLNLGDNFVEDIFTVPYITTGAML